MFLGWLTIVNTPLNKYVKDIKIKIYKIYIVVQFEKPFVAKKWNFNKNPWGWTLNLFPIQIYKK